ncbi:MAG: GAF domain-containing protein [Thermodesulfobacteriota bacterium]|nr:GAF domain-containing protein [Thermodesulfobacteriota bacterium]
MDYPDITKVYELARELNATDNIKGILDTVTDHLPRVLGAKYCSLFVINTSSNELEIKAHNHPDIGDDPFIHISKGQKSIMNLAIERNTSLIIHDIEDEMGVENKDKYDTKSFMCILIKHKDSISGIINLADKAPQGFNKNDMLIVSTIAELLGALFERIDIDMI